MSYSQFNKEHLQFLKSSKIISDRIIKRAKEDATNLGNNRRMGEAALLDFEAWLKASGCRKAIVEQHMYYLKQELNKINNI